VLQARQEALLWAWRRLPSLNLSFCGGERHRLCVPAAGVIPAEGETQGAAKGKKRTLPAVNAGGAAALHLLLLGDRYWRWHGVLSSKLLYITSVSIVS